MGIKFEIKENEFIKIEDVLKEENFKVSKDAPKRIEIQGDMVKVAKSLRLRTFMYKGITCCKCGIKGSYFVKEKTEDQSPWHLNLYALNEDGEEVLMTKDHILPKSKGGRDFLDNMQTMCCICNVKKGNTIE